MDETDISIINRLTQDARMSFRRIAEELRISPDTVINRYAALRQQGVIRGSTIVINPKKIGYQAMAVFMVDTSPTQISAEESIPTDSSLVLEKLIRIPSIIVATKTVGDHDVLAIGVAIDFEHLTNLRNEITGIPGVKDVQISFWVEKTEVCPRYFMI
ncbi:MAG: Lrp/AsnC family transcriptional regulator [Candidatus Atabeyarchaeum deiterrae]